MKRVLVAVLDWGLGHATRSIVVINRLITHGCEVVLAGNGQSLLLLRREFPGLQFIELPPYNPVYPGSNGSMPGKMIAQIPKFLRAVRREHAAVDDAIRQLEITHIVSDNRYGCWSARRPSVIVTHQPSVLMPARFGMLAPVTAAVIGRMLSRFQACWIPDYASGGLSAPMISGARRLQACFFVGPLSRFVPSGNTGITYDVAVVLSGPEPQRSLLEEVISSQLRATSLRYVIVRGVIADGENNGAVNFLTTARLQELMEQSGIVICRSGYSSVMDLAALGKNAILIPTPGQTEQEYLAAELTRRGIVYSEDQRTFDLERALKASATFPGFKRQGAASGKMLDDAIRNLLEMKAT